MTRGNDSNDSIDTGQTSRRRVLAGTATLAAAGIAGCSGGDDSEGTTTGTGTGTAEPTETETETPLTPSSCEPEMQEGIDITEDTTWTASECPRYGISGNIRVQEGATLTIEPGVEIVASEDARINVESGSTLVASGESDNPIWFYGESAQQGYWKGMRFRSSTSNELDNVVVSHGGSESGWSNIIVKEGASLSVTNTVSEQCANQGLYAESGATLSSFANNEFRDNGGPAVAIYTSQIDSLEGNSTFAGNNSDDVIQVYSNTVGDDATWPATDAPYLFDGSHQINGGTVSVDPGAEFQFTQDSRINIQAGTGSFAAEGDAENPVVFKGESETQGYWRGIRYKSNSPDNSLDNVEVSHGGNNSQWSNIYVNDGASLSVTNVVSEQCQTAGLIAESNAELPSFANNEFRDNDGPAVEIYTSQIDSLEGNSTFAGNNADDVIQVYSNTVVDDVTWPATDAPYLFDGSHQINGGAVSVDPGAEIRFTQDSRINVQAGTGSFTAEAGDSDQILFRGEIETQGYWRGIRLKSNNPANSFDNVEIAHGGSDSQWANVYVNDDAQASVTNSTLRDSGTWGIYAEDGAILSYSNVTTQNNAEGGVREPGD